MESELAHESAEVLAKRELERFHEDHTYDVVQMIRERAFVEAARVLQRRIVRGLWRECLLGVMALYTGIDEILERREASESGSLWSWFSSGIGWLFLVMGVLFLIEAWRRTRRAGEVRRRVEQLFPAQAAGLLRHARPT